MSNGIFTSFGVDRNIEQYVVIEVLKLPGQCRNIEKEQYFYSIVRGNIFKNCAEMKNMILLGFFVS